MSFFCSWYALHYILHLLWSGKLHLSLCTCCFHLLILQFHYAYSQFDPIAFANFGSPFETCFFFLCPLFFLTNLFFRLKLLQQLPRLDSCPKINSFNEKITNFFLTLCYFLFKIIKLITKHKKLDFLSQIHLGDGCQMVSTKIFKNFNTRIFCNKIYAQELISWILNKYTKAFYNSYYNNHSVFLAQISSSNDINYINVLHVSKENPCSKLKNKFILHLWVTHFFFPYNSTSIPCIISVTQCAKNSLWKKNQILPSKHY